MKKYILSILLVALIFNLSAQVITQKTISKKVDESIKLTNKSNIDVLTMPGFDVKKLLAEDEINKGLDLPYRFGHAFKVDYNMQNSGTWSQVNGGKVWSLKIVSKGAYSINLAFSKFYLPKDSRLYIYNEQKTVIQGPYTSENNTKDRKLSSDLIEGSAIILEYFEADNVKEKPEISISKVVHAYRNLFSNSTKSYGSSESCNIDVNCPEGDDWQDESDAVAMILINNNALCSGCMVNNTAQDFTPYFLTANHCISGQNVDNWTFRFQYKSPTCGGGDDYSYYSYYGADLEAHSSVSDFALLELDTRPNGNTGITYAGWSRSATAPTSAVGIHHPSGDVMKISIDSDQAISVAWGGGQANSHWRVSYDDGVVEHGSSGSPLFDQNHRIVGQLHGNQNYNPNLSYCEQPIGEYGRFDVSWTHGLSQFLDPGNTGAMTTNTIKIPYVTGTNLVCTSNSTFTLHNRPPNSSVSWTHSSNLTSIGCDTCITYIIKAKNSYVNGNAWVKATINGVVFTKTFWVGKPKFTVEGDEQLEIRMPGIAMIDYSNGGGGSTNVFWTRSGAIATVNGGPVTAKFRAGSRPGMGAVYATVTNTCGSKENRLLVEVTGGWYSIYPNPSSDVLYIKIDKDKMPKYLITERIEIKLYDKMMRFKRQSIINADITPINVNGLQKGVYIIQLISGKKTYEEKILISR